MTPPVFVQGVEQTASAVTHKIGRATSTTTINDSSSFVNATGLSFTIGASETWAFVTFWEVTTNSTADFKASLTVPSGASMDYRWSGGFVNNAGSGNFPQSSNSPMTSADGNMDFQIGGGTKAAGVMSGWVGADTTAGTVQMRAAQNTATAVNTVVEIGSYVIAWKV